jgi:hypothetical protein
LILTFTFTYPSMVMTNGNNCAQAKEVIRTLSQDPLGIPGDLVWAERRIQVWAAPIRGGGRGVVVLNRDGDRSGKPASFRLLWKYLGYPKHARLAVRDLYARDALSTAGITEAISLQVPAAGCFALKVTPLYPRLAEGDGGSGKHAGSSNVTRAAGVQRSAEGQQPEKTHAEWVEEWEAWRPWHAVSFEQQRKWVRTARQ